MATIKELILNYFENLKEEHQINCNLIEEELEEGYSMMFDSEKNSIVFDCRRIEEIFQQGKNCAFLDYDISRFIFLCLLHEIGHYYDFQENDNAFNIKSKEEYIQMELRGIQKAKKNCPLEMLDDFDRLNKYIIDCYRRYL